jgi:large subunit ribosomal protein L30
VPAKKAKKTPGASGRLRVEQVRSGIGHPKGHRATLRSIGLKHHQDVVVVADTPTVRGMLNQVRHLIEVTPVGEG